MKERTILFSAFIVLLVLTLIVYFNKKNDLISTREQLKKRYDKVYVIAKEYETLLKLKSSKTSSLKEGLLSFLQNSSSRIGIAQHIVSIKPVPGRTEVVDVLYQKLTLNNILDIFTTIEGYSNLRVRSFSISKRFDDPWLADLNMQIEKMK